MIGGQDIVIPVGRGPEALDVAIRAVSRLWPAVVLEDAITGKPLGAYSDIDFARSHEILAFRDSRAARQWEEIGAHPSLDGTLLHFILSPTVLTVTIDANPPAEIASFVSDLRRSLRQDLFAAGSSAEAA